MVDWNELGANVIVGLIALAILAVIIFFVVVLPYLQYQECMEVVGRWFYCVKHAL